MNINLCKHHKAVLISALLIIKLERERRNNLYVVANGVTIQLIVQAGTWRE